MQEHKQFENFTNKWHESFRNSGKKVFCREGCSGCCSLAVHATYPEAAAAAETLSAKQHKQLELYILRLHKILPELADLKSYLKRHRQEIGPCPFLDGLGSCSIYSVRPISCRSLLSTRAEAWCTVDFAELSEWDKQAYESGLDRSVVAWPTHYVAATQEYGQDVEAQILGSMQKQLGWALSGNFALMVWLARQYPPDEQVTPSQLQNTLQESQLDSQLLLNFAASNR